MCLILSSNGQKRITWKFFGYGLVLTEIKAKKKNRNKYKKALKNHDYRHLERILLQTIGLKSYVQEVNAMIREHTDNVEIITAPYEAKAQLSYFLKKRKIDYVFSSDEFILFGREVITGFSFLDNCGVFL